MMKILARMGSSEARIEMVNFLNGLGTDRIYKLSAGDISAALTNIHLITWIGSPKIRKQRLFYILDIFAALNERGKPEGGNYSDGNFFASKNKIFVKSTTVILLFKS